MIYFINEGLGASNSGIEHAEFDRARLFRKAGIPFQLMTTNYLPKLHEVLPMFNLRDIESCNLFDYFQKARTVKTKKLDLSEIDFGMDADLEKQTETSYVATVKGYLIGRVQVDVNGRLERIEYFEGCGNLYKVETYDVRGFKSLTQFYSPDNNVEVEIWHDVDGKPAIEKTYALTTHGKVVETWKINNRIFYNLQSVRQYFYNCVNADGNNMFIMDRANVSEWQLTKLDKPAYIVFMLHNHQSSDAQNPDAEILNDNYEWVLANMDKWNCIVSATPQQTRDVSKRWPGHKYYTIPVGVIPDLAFQEPHIPMAKRKRHSMLVTARIAREKGIDKMIEALAIAQKKIPDLTLDVYGYVDHSNNDAAMRSINEARKKLKNPKSFTLHGHTNNVKALHQQAQVYLVYSQMEGFNLAMMEAQSVGMVGLTNDVNYGPNELVKDGQNGYIAPFDDVNAYAQKMVDLFSDDDKLQQLSDGAYELSNRYCDDAVLKAWNDVMQDYQKWTQEQSEISTGFGQDAQNL